MSNEINVDINGRLSMSKEESEKKGHLMLISKNAVSHLQTTKDMNMTKDVALDNFNSSTETLGQGAATLQMKDNHATLKLEDSSRRRLEYLTEQQDEKNLGEYGDET